MKTRSRIRLVGVVVSSLIFLVGLLSFALAGKGWTTAAMSPGSENTFEFTNNETEDASDLHIKWSHAVTLGAVKPFKKKEGSGKSSTDFSNGVVKPGGKASVTVSWDGSDPEIREWYWTKGNGERLGEVKTGNPTSMPAPSSTTRDGLRIVTFDTLQGRVIVNLPDDMRASDTISGTVVAEPKGNTEEERKKNASTLSGYVIDISTPKKPDGTSDLKVSTPVALTPSAITFKLPPANALSPFKSVSSSHSVGLGISLTSTSGSLATSPTQTVPIELVSLSLQSVQPITVKLPTIGQQGRPIEIIGPFDGNSTDIRTKWCINLTVSDCEKNPSSGGVLHPQAESPRKLVVDNPINVFGPIQIQVNEGNTETKGTFRNVGVNLTAPKTNLLKGESTELHIEVQGLQGIKEPVPLTLESHGVITMEGGMFQPLVIQPSQVGADGRYTTTRRVTGVQAGGWEATATVVTQPFNIVLRDPDPPQTILINSFTGDYAFCGSGTKLSGTGEIKRKGCVITLTDNQPDRQVQGTLNACAPVDNGGFFFIYSATDIGLVVIDPNSKRTKVYFKPPSRPAPPVQDVSAFATCP